MNIYAYIAAAVLLIGSYAGTYFYGRSAGADGVRIEWAEASKLQREKEAEKADKAATNLEVSRERTRVVYRTITQEIDRIVDRPVYRNTCLDDDGLRLARCAIRGESHDTCKPDQPLQRTPEPTRRDGRSSVALDHAGVGDLSPVLGEASGTGAGG